MKHFYKKMFNKFKLTFNFAIKMLGLFSRRSLLFPPRHLPPLSTVPSKVMTVTVDNPINAKVQISKKHHLSLIILTLKEGLSSFFYNGNKLRGITQ